MKKNFITNKHLHDKINKEQSKLRLFCNNFSLADRFSTSLVGRGKKELGYKFLLKALAISRRTYLSSETTKKVNNYTTPTPKHTVGNSPEGATYLPRQMVYAQPYTLKQNGALQEVAQAQQVASICRKAIINIKPVVETRKVRRGGATYQVPFVLDKERQEGVAIHWLIDSTTRQKYNNVETDILDLQNKRVHLLSLQFRDSLKNAGQSLEKRNQIHQLALNNRAYTHYRWW